MPSLRPFVLAAALLGTAPAYAQVTTSQAAPPPGPPVEQATGGDSLTIGVGVATVPRYEGSNHNRVIPAAAARGSYKGFTFSTRGTLLFVDVIPTGPGPVVDFMAGPVVGAEFNRTNKNLGNAQVERLGKLKTAIDAGGFVGVGKTGVITSDYDKISVSVSYVHDVNNVANSYVITPQFDYGTPLSRKIYVGISSNVTFAGTGYLNTYFGVNPVQSIASGLPVYSRKGGMKSASWSGLVDYSLTGDLLHGVQLVGGVNYSRLTDQFALSPVVRRVGSANQVSAALGLAYTF